MKIAAEEGITPRDITLEVNEARLRARSTACSRCSRVVTAVATSASGASSAQRSMIPRGRASSQQQLERGRGRGIDHDETEVTIVWDPPWSPHAISDEGRKILGIEEDDL